jgi:3-hydroxy-9,10-secoandrosta-1,3,5(10)-triene-9,17-dione monooxygenase reductase component
MPQANPSQNRSARRPRPAAFRAALAQFPTGVTIVTAAGPDRLVGMTVNSFASVSLDPPLVLWSVAKATPSFAAFLAADAYAVHFLGADQRDLAIRFASRIDDKFAGLDHRPGVTGAPVLEGVEPLLECRVWARHDGGDHMILVGEVVAIRSRPHQPLLFHAGVLRPVDEVDLG